LPDSALAKIAARDGMSFNLSNFAMSGNAVLRYTTPDGRGSVGIGNWRPRVPTTSMRRLPIPIVST
jgi:hypothetical protein